MTAKLWFFDLDGTLADTDRDIRDAWRAALADLGLDCPDFDRDFVAGPPIEDMARKLFPDAYTPELGTRLRTLFGEHYDHDGLPHTTEHRHAVARAQALRASGAKVVVATNKRYAGARLVAEKFGWDRIFDGIYAGDMFCAMAAEDAQRLLARAGLSENPGKLKKGELLEFLMRLYAVPREACAIVGDTRSDFMAARETGIASVGVAWGYGTAAELALADRIVSHGEDI